jgi:hypothetical protein
MNLVRRVSAAVERYTGNGSKGNKGGGRGGNGMNDQPLFGGIGQNLRVFAASPEMQKLFQQYYGFDPGAIGSFTADDFAALAKGADKAKQFEKYRNVIESNLKDYMNGVVGYNQMIAKCVTDGATGMQSIDQATFDGWLAWKNYKNNVEVLSAKSDSATARLDTKLAGVVATEQMSLENFRQIAAYRLERKRQEFQKKLPELQSEDAELDINAAWVKSQTKERNRAEKDLSDLLTYGEVRYRQPDFIDTGSDSTSRNRNQGGQGIGSRLWNFVQGK